ncbi:2-keto-4-pentenoate hydratase [Nitriliruptor alkaliphilus]|uniref:2-keto-4-pentenoate hydratase n=1 Tax=Nitriliruptor alkaliphilus TaxID=427918 RepID=UPI000B17EEB7|nr:fumarylacetoacetate hydrolase family protein [Nitriliruptor alkaliphilus]
MNDDAVTSVAELLWEATRSRLPVAPVRDALPAGDLTAAYAVQQRNVARVIDELGWRPNGRKIGLTSPAVQQQLGVDQPDYGTLFAELTYGDGEPVPAGSLLQARIEAEVALVLGDELTVDQPTVADVVRATAYAVPALEIVDSRIRGWDLSIVDTIADNASHGAVVLGTHPRPLSEVDLQKVRMRMCIGTEQVSSGCGADCLGNPLVAATWLARTMVAQGTPLRAGDIVLTGALGPMSPVVPGADVRAEIEGLGSIHTRVIEEAP